MLVAKLVLPSVYIKIYYPRARNVLTREGGDHEAETPPPIDRVDGLIYQLGMIDYLIYLCTNNFGEL